MSIQLTADERARMSPLELETLKRYASSVIGLLRALGTNGPIVVALEDLHWADAPSIDLLLGGVMPLANELPLFIVATSRLHRASACGRLPVAAARPLSVAIVALRANAT